ncbi:peptidase S8/S53 domain-containing protein [Neohortaea acidophila]|uniref:Peptidase S8/S53 domain-containing protein n=1 Tax=Neohortaea acidophila TaxID=245834 RepID=A0A6A6PQF3_9PEZI|nr:peptidase S8/S53 domain-containing protein [Neohortaea acidophila]KAF2482338.1 peptidase S8/S53 domain-containing protein [Neohortaea acidophila]
MRWPSLLATALLLSSASSSHLIKRDYDSHDYYAVHLSPDIPPHQVAESLGLHYDGPLGELRDHHIFRASDRHDHDHVKAAKADLKWRRRRRESGAEQAHILDHVLFSQKQELHKRFPLVRRDARLFPRQGEYENEDLIKQGLNIARDLAIEDPIFQEQWHLFNHVEEGHHLNVTGVWQQGITGKGSAVCIVDDGLDMDSLDLKDNYFAKGSWDFNDVGPDPKPRLSDDRHGTRCAGEVAAVRNDVCGVGVAYDGKISGVRILSKVISNADEATAMNYAFQDNHIYSCSWGPPDDGKSMEAPDVLIQRAMLNGVQNGRGGLGSIYVFAIGNGAAKDDNCNFDGYTNSIYSVSVGGIDRKGLHPYYSEACSAQLVVTYSSGSNDAIHTTDVGLNQCYNGHGGTSAAGPLVAGIYALALQANPKLTWRDIQHITLQTAVKIDQPSDWTMNRAVGKEFSHQFGYGKADAWALVELAKTWKPVKPQAWYFGPWLHVKHAIPEGEKGLTSSFTVTRNMLRQANLERLEHVTVTMNVQHTRRGDLSVDLISPSGMVSYLATHRRNDEARAGYNDWTFMSVAHWGESGVGEWTVVVKDTNNNGHNGTFTDWRIKFYGEAIDASKQGLLPMPGRHDDDNHDVVETQTATVGTTTVSAPTVTGEPPGNPDDHQHRPVNSKPTITTTSVPATPTPTFPPTADENADEPTPTSNPAFLPRPFPTFGVSKRTQVWIYGAITLILIFLAALGGWALYVRRKRKRRWDDYAFEMVDHEDDDDGDDDGDAPSRPEARAGELYDAFAEGSDDEEMFGLGSEDEEESEGEAGRYRDVDPGREGLDVG